MSTLKLAIIGGSYLQLPLVLKAKELAIETHCFSWEDGAVCKKHCDYFYPISILEKERILTECKKIGINGITTIASDAAVPTVNYVASEIGLVGNPNVNSEQYVNKHSMRQALSKGDVRVPKFINFTPKNLGECRHRVKDEGLSLPVIVKPVDRSGSRGVYKVESINQLEPMIIRAAEESFSNNVIVEEYIQGREFSIEAISWNGQHHILAITEKETTGAPFFVELSHHQPASLTESEHISVTEFTLKALTALDVINGASHTEIKITNKGEIFLIETGVRMGGDFIGSDLVKLSTGYDFLRGVIEVALDKFEMPILNDKSFSGVYFLSEERKSIKGIIDQSARFNSIIKAEILNNRLRSVESSNDRSGYFIYKSNHKVTIDELLKIKM